MHVYSYDTFEVRIGHQILLVGALHISQPGQVMHKSSSRVDVCVENWYGVT